MLDIQMFGPINVRDNDRRLGPRDFGGVKPKQILEILLEARGHPVPKPRLADMLWGESLPLDATAALENYVSVLRRRLEPGAGRGRSVVVTEFNAYRIDTESVVLDLSRFDSLLARATDPANRSRRQHLEEAITLVRGEVLEDEPYSPWAERLRETYNERYLKALLDAADAALAERDLMAGLARAQRAVDVDPLNERACRVTMLAHYAMGHQQEALRVFDRCCKALADDLGVDPFQETIDLRDAVLRHEDRATLLPAPPATAAPVVRQARPKAQVPPLLGREAELTGLEGRVRAALDGTAALVLVEGEAGSGKSRLLEELVGLLPDVTVTWARCSELERELPYAPLARVLRELTKDVDIDPSGYPGIGEILPELATDGVRPSGSALHALESFVALIGEHTPALLVFDDLHWADACTVAALHYALHRWTDVPLAIVATVAPEALEADHPVRRLQPGHRVELGPLDRGDLAPLGVPGLYERTGGHPLFVAALIEALANGPSHEVPTQLVELVVTHCRNAGPFAHELLVHAALLEEPFGPELLSEMLDTDAGKLVHELERLCERRLLAVDGPGFRFRHALAREALGASLSPARRRLLEARARQSSALVTAEADVLAS